jgi:hypothetical protein
VVGRPAATCAFTDSEFLLLCGENVDDDDCSGSKRATMIYSTISRGKSARLGRLGFAAWSFG